MGTTTREMTFWLAEPERRVLRAMARRLPYRVTSNHLTGIGVIGAAGTAGAYALSAIDAAWLWAASVMLAVNWFGDSLDGTLARVRRAERPRYGYYLDHAVDALNTAAIGIGLGLSPFVRLELALIAVILYLTLSINVYLESNVFGVFRLSYGRIGPTEARITLIVVNTGVALGAASLAPGAWLWWAGNIAVASVTTAMAVMLLVRFSGNLRRLSKLEPRRPQRGGQANGLMSAARRRAVTLLLPVIAGLGTAGCFATLQTARVEPGFHISAGAAVMHDGVRDGFEQGSDVVVGFSPSFGIGGEKEGVGLELGIPGVLYFEDGLGDRKEGAPLILPYLKLGLLQDRRDKIALVAQTAYVLPISFTAIYSHDFARWTPYVSVKQLFSRGPAGDDPVITRYQRADQSMWAFAVGAEWRGSRSARPGVEIGLFTNSYAADSGGPRSRVLERDLYVGAKIGF